MFGDISLHLVYLVSWRETASLISINRSLIANQVVVSVSLRRYVLWDT